MYVNGPSRLNAVGAAQAGRRKAGGGSLFTLEEEQAETQRSTATGATRGLQGIDALLALQGVEDPLTGRKRAVRRGFDILDILEQLKLDLLAGRVSPERLTRLLVVVERQQDATGDEKLDALLAEIELRARVELAKLGR